MRGSRDLQSACRLRRGNFAATSCLRDCIPGQSMMSDHTLRYLEVFLPTIVPTLAAFVAVYATFWLTRRSERQSRSDDQSKKNEAIRTQLRNEMQTNQRRIATWILSSDPKPELGRSALETFTSGSLDVLTSVPLTPFSFDMWTARLNELPGALSDEELQGSWRFYDSLRELAGLVTELRRASDQDASIRGAQPMPDPFVRSPNYSPPQEFNRVSRATLGRFNELGPYLLTHPCLSNSEGQKGT